MSGVHTDRLRLATRGSALALIQAKMAAARLLELAGVETELVVVASSGDRDTTTPIASFSDRGIFTADVDRAVQEGRADVSVHSAKDLPSSSLGDNIALCAIPERGEVRDALVGVRLSELGDGARVATGAIRRRVQLLHHRPDLTFTEVRGNIGTRLRKVPENGALVVALVALTRLDLEGRADEVLSTDLMLPQVGQGAIALCCRDDDEVTRSLVVKVDDLASSKAVHAERSFLKCAGGGCDAPLAGFATVDRDGSITLEGVVASIDGSKLVRRKVTGSDPEATGRALYHELNRDEIGAVLLGSGAPRKPES